MKSHEDIPPGWRILRMEEGRTIKPLLDSILGDCDIIAFESGALDGASYGRKFRYDSHQYGEKFVLKL